MNLRASRQVVGFAATLDEVIERMLEIEAALPAGDGVGYFNKLYLEVTRAVVVRLGRGEFEHGPFPLAARRALQQRLFPRA